MSFAIPVTDPAAIRCNAIIERLVNHRVGTVMHDEGWRHGAEWIGRAEGIRHPHPTIAFDGDAIIRALVDDPSNEVWQAEGAKWLSQFQSAQRVQRYFASMTNLPECRDTADLVAANID
ncbi:hypothetical protein C7441_11055 [Pseudaminobacter salicylatoxidans]|uniref:Uncharacterized protein n=1 Tax=Pseudaminobacter salicylatoxidans TaxID=93369 RepID=A0A316C0I3_PSESE|nr:hypothetical protein [Pseudaminobacter salicylatoxidans]PWJ81523.1 hypothetical protein C7441_11055 [Pseudaminobacter salicylatoxidans]